MVKNTPQEYPLDDALGNLMLAFIIFFPGAMLFFPRLSMPKFV